MAAEGRKLHSYASTIPEVNRMLSSHDIYGLNLGFCERIPLGSFAGGFCSSFESSDLLRSLSLVVLLVTSFFVSAFLDIGTGGRRVGWKERGSG